MAFSQIIFRHGHSKKKHKSLKKTFSITPRSSHSNTNIFYKIQKYSITHITSHRQYCQLSLKLFATKWNIKR